MLVCRYNILVDICKKRATGVVITLCLLLDLQGCVQFASECGPLHPPVSLWQFEDCRQPPRGTTSVPFWYVPEPLAKPRSPMIGLEPMSSPGMTSQQFLGVGGRSLFCNTTDDGYGGPLTICQ